MFERATALISVGSASSAMFLYMSRIFGVAMWQAASPQSRGSLGDVRVGCLGNALSRDAGKLMPNPDYRPLTPGIRACKGKVQQTLLSSIVILLHHACHRHALASSFQTSWQNECNVRSPVLLTGVSAESYCEAGKRARSIEVSVSVCRLSREWQAAFSTGYEAEMVRCAYVQVSCGWVDVG